MANKLPCPFCGSTKLSINRSDCSYHDPPIAFNVHCSTDKCHGNIFALGLDLFKTKDEAIAAWNVRQSNSKAKITEVTYDALKKRITELEAALCAALGGKDD